DGSSPWFVHQTNPSWGRGRPHPARAAPGVAQYVTGRSRRKRRNAAVSAAAATKQIAAPNRQAATLRSGVLRLRQPRFVVTDRLPQDKSLALNFGGAMAN